MLCRTIALVAVVLGIPACGGSDVSVRHSWEQRDARTTASGDMLAIVDLSASPGDGLAECVEDALYKQEAGETFIPSREFRDSVFPWFEPGIAPASAEQLQKVIGSTRIERRIDALGLRYLILLRGSTQTSHGSWGGCAGGGAGAACVGGMSSDEETDLTARIVDLQTFAELGRVEASAAGSSEIGMIVLIPYFVASAAEFDACTAIAKSIVGFLHGAGAPAARGAVR